MLYTLQVFRLFFARHPTSTTMTTSNLPTTEQYEAVKSALMGRKVTGISANTRQPIYGVVVNVRLCMSSILVDIENGGWVRNSHHYEVEIYSA
jgi:hypothetical protein